MISAWRNFKIIFSRPLFIIIFRPKILFFVTYSILTRDTKVEFVSLTLLRFKTSLAPQNDSLNLSFVKDTYVDGGKLARNGRKTAIRAVGSGRLPQTLIVAYLIGIVSLGGSKAQSFLIYGSCFSFSDVVEPLGNSLMFIWVLDIFTLLNISIPL